MILGLLDEPRDIGSKAFNVTHTKIYWQAPFTLNVTDVEPDILDYTVCISIDTIITNSTCMNESTKLEAVIPNFNVHKNISVSAWNALGEGKAGQLLLDACDVPLQNKG